MKKFSQKYEYRYMYVACGRDLSFFGKRLGYEYHRCTQCGSLQMAPLPAKETLDRSYGNEYVSANHLGADGDAYRLGTQAYFHAILDTLLRHGLNGRITRRGTARGEARF